MLNGLAVIAALIFIGYLVRKWLERRRIQVLLESEYQKAEKLMAEDPEFARQVEEGVFDE